jgi:hypothetical protein
VEVASSRLKLKLLIKKRSSMYQRGEKIKRNHPLLEKTTRSSLSPLLTTSAASTLTRKWTLSIS